MPLISSTDCSFEVIIFLQCKVDTNGRESAKLIAQYVLNLLGKL